MRSFRSSLRLVAVDIDNTNHLAATLLQEVPRNVPWYMTDSSYCCSVGWLQRSCRECCGPRVEVAAVHADENTPPPHFGLDVDVVYKMGILTDTINTLRF